MKIITHFNSIYSFETDRLYARKIEQSDLHYLELLHQDPKTMQDLGGVLAPVKSKEKMDHWLTMDANLNVHMTHFAQYLDQVELVRIPGYTLVNTSLPDVTFNYVIETDLSVEDARNKIVAITDYFNKKRIPFSWWISPFDKPQNLAELLEDNAYANTENNVAMYLDLDTWQPALTHTDLEIVRAFDLKTLQDCWRFNERC